MGLTMLGRQTDIHIDEPLVSEPSCFKVGIAINNFKSCKSPVLIKFRHN
jgi:hypothetical protein